MSALAVAAALTTGSAALAEPPQGNRLRAELTGGIGTTLDPLDPNSEHRLAIPLLLGGGIHLTRRYSLSGQLNLTLVPSVRKGLLASALLGPRVDFRELLFFRALVGIGGGNGCFRGDFCGGGGVAGALEVGTELFPELALRPLLLGRVYVQTGLANVGVLVTPSLTAGIAL